MSGRTGPPAAELEGPIVRKLSRHMPPLGTATMTTEGCFLWCIPFAALLYFVPQVFGIALVLSVPIILLNLREENRLARLAAERRDESICSFARSFPRRSVDPWVLRAMHEELGRLLGSSLPPRPTDRFCEEYRMLDEDVEDLIVGVADRAGRSLDKPEENPHYADIGTVGGLVRFLSAQPPSPAGLALRPYLRGTA